MKSISRFSRFTILSAAIVAFLLPVGALGQDRTKRPREEKLLNGLKVLMWSDPAAKDVSVKIRIHAGSAFDPQGKEGVMRLLADNIFPNAAAKEYFAEDLNGSLKVDTTYDYIQISASSDPAQFLTMLDTLASAVINPTIDKPTTATLRESLIKEIRLNENDTEYVADQAAAKRLFGTFPYGRPMFGTSESVNKIDFADLIDARLRFLTADNATIAVVGNFNAQRGWQAIRRYFGAWLKSDRRVPSTFRQPDPPQTERLIVASPKPNESAIRFLIRSAARGDKDFAATRIYAALLDARILARIPEAFVDKAFVRADEHVLPGAITVGFSAARNDVGTGNGKVQANDLLAKAMNDPINDAEFARAKAVTISEWSSRNTATLWLDADTFKTSGMAAEISAFERTSLADVQAIASRMRAADSVSVLVNTPTK